LGRAIEKQLGGIVREEPTLQLDAWLKLDEIDLELADAVEMLAPFGAGNPPLKLATRGVKLKSAAEIGRTKEHLRLTVEDEDGNVQNILWWGGAGEPLPELESRIDIAYSLRASTFRGQKQVNLTFEEFRVTQEKALEIRESKLEIQDWRLQTNRLSSLGQNVLVWAEGADKTKGKSRYDLMQADELVIYTTPPSPVDLRAALDLVKPVKVIVAGISPASPRTDEFLSQLAGMTKYAINNKGGKASIKELAVAAAQRESAVRIGLEWLAAGGHVSISGEDDAVFLSAGNGEGNQYLHKELFTAVRGILEETAAYRAYFSTAAVESLLREG
jgi:single-stranded-DNA-specific exonuclease